jgi:alkylation response protein AidB-like acyl-CoA dehydrogenase
VAHREFMTTTHEVQATEQERDLVAWSAELGAMIRNDEALHDDEGTFVSEAYDLLRQSGYLALAVPTELGGRGATIRQVAMAQRELARHCASTALASVMHHHVVLFTAWRLRRGLPGAEATLRRVVDDGIVLVSTGGADQTRPRGTAKRVDGGYEVSGRKIFASQAPVGTVMSTMFPYDDPDDGLVVLNMAVPMASPGVSIVETWDALGMRGTGSHDIELNDVFVPDERVLARRPHGKVDGPLQVILTIAMPPIAAVYLGVAEAARDHAVAAVTTTSRGDDAIVQRQVGLMDTRLRVAGWALDGALRTAGDDPVPSMETVAAVMAAKREIALAGIEVCDLAMDVAGGAAYYRTSPIARCYRDVRGAKFHPFGPDETLVHAGRLALGRPADER